MFINHNIIDKQRRNSLIGENVLDDSNIRTRNKLKKFLESQTQNSEDFIINPISNLDKKSSYFYSTSRKNSRQNKVQKKFSNLYTRLSGTVINKTTKIEEYYEKFYYSKFLHFECVNFLFSFISIIIGVTHYEFSYDYSLEDDTEDQERHFDILLYFSSLFSIFLWINLILYEITVLEYKKKIKTYISTESIFTSGRWKNLSMNILLSLIHPNPIFINYKISLLNNFNQIYVTKSINSFLTMISLIRFYFILRFTVFLSDWMSPETSSLCTKYKFNTNVLFSIKSMLQRTPLIIYPTVSLCFLFIFSFCIRVLEKGIVFANQDYNNYFNIIWYLLITMLGVGYGDYSVRSSEGRIIAMLACLFGSFLTSLLLLTLTNYFNLKKSEVFMYKLSQRVKMMDNNSERAKNVIGQFMKNKSKGNIKRKNEPIKIKFLNNKPLKEMQDSKINFLIDSVKKFGESSDLLNQAQIYDNKFFDIRNGINYLEKQYSKILESDETLEIELKNLCENLKILYEEELCTEDNEN
jgi:hypothetical protein